MKDERTERGVQRHFIIYTIFFYSQYMKMEGKSDVIKDSRQRSTVQKSVYTTKQSPKRVSTERRGDTLQVPTQSDL